MWHGNLHVICLIDLCGTNMPSWHIPFLHLVSYSWAFDLSRFVRDNRSPCVLYSVAVKCTVVVFASWNYLVLWSKRKNSGKFKIKVRIDHNLSYSWSGVGQTFYASKTFFSSVTMMNEKHENQFKLDLRSLHQVLALKPDWNTSK